MLIKYFPFDILKKPYNLSDQHMYWILYTNAPKGNDQTKLNIYIKVHQTGWRIKNVFIFS